MKEIQELREQYWKTIDWSLPTWALIQDWETFLKDHVSDQTEPLCDHCVSVLKQREKIMKKLMSK